VAGEISENGAVGGPTRRIRPHWWAVLAVSVSLLALVAATSGHPNTPVGTAAAHSPSALHPARSKTAPPTTSTSTSTTTTEPEQGPDSVTPPTSASLPGSSSTAGARVVVRQSPSVSTTPSTTATTTTSSGSSVAVAAAVQPVLPVKYGGNLQQPDDASASYAFAGTGSMQVSASSTSTAPLLLTVTCQAGPVSEAGSSFVSVVIPNADGPCDVVLKETVVQYVAVPYTLTIGPEGG
jgi:hypothetical protein